MSPSELKISKSDLALCVSCLEILFDHSVKNPPAINSYVNLEKQSPRQNDIQHE